MNYKKYILNIILGFSVLGAAQSSACDVAAVAVTDEDALRAQYQQVPEDMRNMAAACMSQVTGNPADPSEFLTLEDLKASAALLVGHDWPQQSRVVLDLAERARKVEGFDQEKAIQNLENLLDVTTSVNHGLLKGEKIDGNVFFVFSGINGLNAAKALSVFMALKEEHPTMKALIVDTSANTRFTKENFETTMKLFNLPLPESKDSIPTGSREFYESILGQLDVSYEVIPVSGERGMKKIFKAVGAFLATQTAEEKESKTFVLASADERQSALLRGRSDFSRDISLISAVPPKNANDGFYGHTDPFISALDRSVAMLRALVPVMEAAQDKK